MIGTISPPREVTLKLAGHMSTDPYAPPAADLDSTPTALETSLWHARGRLGVLSYWAQSGLLTVLAAVAFAISGSADILYSADPSTAIDAESLMQTGVVGLLILPLLLLLAYIGICMLIKRLHDLNRSGWWCLLLLIPLLNVVFSLYMFFWPGKGSNRFGAPRATLGWETILGVVFLTVTLLTAVAGFYLGLTERLAPRSSGSIEESTRAMPLPDLTTHTAT